MLRFTYSTFYVEELMQSGKLNPNILSCITLLQKRLAELWWILKRFDTTTFSVSLRLTTKDVWSQSKTYPNIINKSTINSPSCAKHTLKFHLYLFKLGMSSKLTSSHTYLAVDPQWTAKTKRIFFSFLAHINMLINSFVDLPRDSQVISTLREASRTLLTKFTWNNVRFC